MSTSPLYLDQASHGRPMVIAVEGLDATGKTTLAAALAEVLGAELFTTPPAELRGGPRRAIDSVYTDHPLASQLFYASTLAYVSDRMRETLTGGRHAVVDRFWLSTLSYDVLRRDALDLDPLVAQLLPCDLTLYLHAPVAVRAQRLAHRGHITPADQQSLAADGLLRESYNGLLTRPACGRVLQLDTHTMDVAACVAAARAAMPTEVHVR